MVRGCSRARVLGWWKGVVVGACCVFVRVGELLSLFSYPSTPRCGCLAECTLVILRCGTVGKSYALVRYATATATAPLTSARVD